jgi:hypothetical protein
VNCCDRVATFEQQTRQDRSDLTRADNRKSRFYGADPVPSGVGVGIGALM